MIRVLQQVATQVGLREDVATIAALDAATMAYTLVYRAATIAPVWSRHGVRYAVGSLVRVLVAHGRVEAIVP